ncbi:hypothetical protein MTP99_016324 [Tenebrio molitor]|nr:hypothetical protein MTP99_016324 [Tenebrio molitor]
MSAHLTNLDRFIGGVYDVTIGPEDADKAPETLEAPSPDFFPDSNRIWRRPTTDGATRERAPNLNHQCDTVKTNFLLVHGRSSFWCF